MTDNQLSGSPGRIDLDALEAALNAATPGQWDNDNNFDAVFTREPGKHSQRIADCEVSGIFITECAANGRFIALSHNALPALIAELRAVRREIATLRGALVWEEHSRAETARIEAEFSAD